MCWPPTGKCCMSSLEETPRQIRTCLGVMSRPLECSIILFIRTAEWSRELSDFSCENAALMTQIQISRNIAKPGKRCLCPGLWHVPAGTLVTAGSGKHLFVHYCGWDQPSPPYFQFLVVFTFHIENTDKDLRNKVSATANVEYCCQCSVLECFSLNIILWKLNENIWLIFIVEFWTPRGIIASNVHSMAVWIWMSIYLFTMMFLLLYGCTAPPNRRPHWKSPNQNFSCASAHMSTRFTNNFVHTHTHTIKINISEI